MLKDVKSQASHAQQGLAPALKDLFQVQVAIDPSIDQLPLAQNASPSSLRSILIGTAHFTPFEDLGGFSLRGDGEAEAHLVSKAHLSRTLCRMLRL